MNGHASLCAMLVSAGADFNLKNSFGVSPFGEAEAAGHMEVALKLCC
jgi:ankyrin repeat protein